MHRTCRRSRSARQSFNRKGYEKKGKSTAVVTSTSVTSPYRGDQFLHRVPLKSIVYARRGLQRSLTGDPGEVSPIPEQLCDPICVRASA